MTVLCEDSMGGITLTHLARSVCVARLLAWITGLPLLLENFPHNSKMYLPLVCWVPPQKERVSFLNSARTSHEETCSRSGK